MSVIRIIFSWRTVVYLIYALLLTGLLLYVRFPSQTFKQFCENGLERIFPESVCTIERVNYRFPLTIRFEAVNFRSTGFSGRPGLFIDSLSVAPDLAKPRGYITLAATAYGGSLFTRLEVNFTAKKIELHDVQITGIDVAALQKSFAVQDRKVSGTLGLTGRYQATFDHPAGGSGEGRIVADAGSVALLQPVLSLQQIDFYQAVGTLRYENKKLSVSEGKLKGKDLTADFAGNLQVASSFLASEVQIGGRLVPQAAFLETHPQEQKMVQGVMKRFNMSALPFKVGGTLSSPTFRFSP